MKEKNLILAFGRQIYLTKSLHSSPMKVTPRGKTSYITHTDIATYRLNWHRGRFTKNRKKPRKTGKKTKEKPLTSYHLPLTTYPLPQSL